MLHNQFLIKIRKVLLEGEKGFDKELDELKAFVTFCKRTVSEGHYQLVHQCKLIQKARDNLKIHEIECEFVAIAYGDKKKKHRLLTLRDKTSNACVDLNEHLIEGIFDCMFSSLDLVVSPG